MRDKPQTAAGSFNGHSNHCGWIDIKSFLAGILAMGFFIVLQENAQRYNIKLWGARDDHMASVYNKSEPGWSMGRVADSTPMAPCPAVASPGGQELREGRINNGTSSNYSAAPYDVDLSGAKSTARLEEEEEAAAAGQGGLSSEKLREVRRSFREYGRAAALFVEMGAYRGGPTSFAVVGLASKPIHVFGNAGFECEWQPASAVSPARKSVKGVAEKMLPDWNMGRQYTVVVVNCTFREAVGTDLLGGQLILHASYGRHVDGSPEERATERIVALSEAAGEYDPATYQSPFPYDFVYCGSPLYGDLNPQRIREWIAYHVWRLGPRSHFFIYDAGGVSSGVGRALRPWQRLGYVTVYDVRQQEMYDGYYHNQFLIVNDCFHRARFLSNWTFFFDVDEYLYVPANETLYSVMDGFSGYTQIMFLQKPMSATLCRPKRASTNGTDDISREDAAWGFEKLVYRNVQEGVTWDRKYAIQPRNAFATGIHRSDHIVGASLGYELQSIAPKIRYYHYHATINHKGQLCREVPTATIVNATTISSSSSSSPSPSSSSHRLVFYDSKQVPFTLDTGLQALAPSVKQFELQHIGPQPTIAT